MTQDPTQFKILNFIWNLFNTKAYYLPVIYFLNRYGWFCFPK